MSHLDDAGLVDIGQIGVEAGVGSMTVVDLPRRLVGVDHRGGSTI